MTGAAMKCWSFQGPGVHLTARGVVFADTEDEARQLVCAAMSFVTKVSGPQAIEITEIDATGRAAYILFDGDY